jgi:hypothetical protein
MKSSSMMCVSAHADLGENVARKHFCTNEWGPYSQSPIRAIYFNLISRRRKLSVTRVETTTLALLNGLLKALQGFLWEGDVRFRCCLVTGGCKRLSLLRSVPAER